MKKYSIYCLLLFLSPLALKAMYSGKEFSALEERYRKSHGWLIGGDDEFPSKGIKEDNKEKSKTDQDNKQNASSSSDS